MHALLRTRYFNRAPASGINLASVAINKHAIRDWQDVTWKRLMLWMVNKEYSDKVGCQHS